MDCCSAHPRPTTAASVAQTNTPARLMGARRLPRVGALVAAVGVALLPKCPACWSVYAGISSWLGVSFVVEPQRLRALSLLSLGLALIALGSMAWRRRSLWPVVAGALSAAGVWLGKFVLVSEALTSLSLLALIAVSIAARRVPLPRRAHSELPEHAEAR